jgi:hypothetical protein
MKAALFSAFVFPGSGHFLLKKPVQGGLLAGVSVMCVVALVSAALEKAQEISLKIQSGEIPLDITRITDEVSKQVAGSSTQLTDFSTYLLLICWLAGIVDSYRVGCLQDKADSTGGKQP